MQIIRTILWVLLLVALAIFSWANRGPTITVKIWENIVVDTKIPVIIIVSFLIGIVPMYLFHRFSKWRLHRKIASLESAARTAAATPIAPNPMPEPDPVPDIDEPTPEPSLSSDDTEGSTPTPRGTLG